MCRALSCALTCRTATIISAVGVCALVNAQLCARANMGGVGKGAVDGGGDASCGHACRGLYGDVCIMENATFRA